MAVFTWIFVFVHQSQMWPLDYWVLFNLSDIGFYSHHSSLGFVFSQNMTMTVLSFYFQHFRFSDFCFFCHIFRFVESHLYFFLFISSKFISYMHVSNGNELISRVLEWDTPAKSVLYKEYTELYLYYPLVPPKRQTVTKIAWLQFLWLVFSPVDPYIPCVNQLWFPPFYMYGLYSYLPIKSQDSTMTFPQLPPNFPWLYFLSKISKATFTTMIF